jgi:hypothetical protein
MQSRKNPAMSSSASRYEPGQRSYPISPGFVEIPAPVSPSGDLTRFIHTNEEPHPLTAQEISTSLVAPEKARLAAIEANVAKQQAILRELEWLRNESMSSLCSYQSAVSAIRRLPSEVLYQIFCQACELVEEHDVYYMSTAWILSRVCRRWNYVYVPWPRTILADDAFVTVDVVEQAVVIDTDTGEPRSPHLLWSIIEEIKEEASHWKTLKIICSEDDILLGRFLPLKGRLDAVEEFSLHLSSTQLELCQFGFGCHDSQETRDIFLELPRLRKLTIQSALGWMHVKQLLLPLHQIEDLELIEYNVARFLPDVMSILTAMPRLKECKVKVRPLNFAHWAERDQIPATKRFLAPHELPVLEHPVLSSLSITIYACDILAYLTLPALETFQINDLHRDRRYSNRVHDSAATTAMLEDFLTKRASNVKALRVSDVDVSYVGLLECLPSVVELWIVDHHHVHPSGENYLSMFLDRICSATPGEFLPGLQKSELHYWSTSYNITADIKQRLRDIRPELEVQLSVFYR